MTLSDERAQEYVRLIRKTLRRYRSSPMWEDLISYVTWKVCEALHRQSSEDQDHAYGLVQQNALWSARQFFHSQHCDIPFRFKVNERGYRLPFQLSWEEEIAAEDSREWLERRIEPDFVPLLIEAIWREGLWERLALFCSARDLQIIARWLAGERQAAIAVALGIHRNRVQFCIQRGLNHLRQAEGQRLGYVRSEKRTESARERRRERSGKRNAA